MQAFITKFLSTVSIKQKFVDYLTSPSSLSYYTTACTDPSYDEDNNYLFLRELGTLGYHKTIVWYCYDKFKNLDQEILTKIRNNLMKDDSIGEYMMEFGLSEFILYDSNLKLTKKNYQHFFEAMIGATEFLINKKYKFGIGNNIVCDLCSFFLDQIPISETNLTDSKTVLKEFLDRNKQFNLIKQEDKNEEGLFSIKLFIQGTQIGEGKSSLKIDAEQIASQMAIRFLEEKGFMIKKTKEKIMKRDTSVVHVGIRGKEFQDFILKLLTQIPFSIELDKDDLFEMSKSFTHNEVSKDNYELIETLGDITINKCSIWYISNRFPELNTPEGIDIATKLKIVLIQTKTLSRIALDLGFYKYISFPTSLNTKDQIKMLEDVCEAFFASLELIVDKKFGKGSGYVACYKLLENILDNEEISLNYENLADPTTRLKELFDRYKLIKIKYIKKEHNFDYDENNPSIHPQIKDLFKKYNIKKSLNEQIFESQISEANVLVEGCGCNHKHMITTHDYIADVLTSYGEPFVSAFGFTEKEAKQNVSVLALEYYKKKGIQKMIPKEYLKYCV